MGKLELAFIALCVAACDKTSGEGAKAEKAEKAEKKAEPEEKGDKKKKSDDSDKDDKDDKKVAKKKSDDDEPPPKPTEPPACTVNAQKVWAKGINTLTGLTAIAMTDGRTAIGYATGNTPQVLVVGSKGEGKLLKVAVDPASTFAARAPKAGQGSRAIWRVTPVKLEDKGANAFVDFRDEYKLTEPKGVAEKGKRVVCGPTDSQEKWVKDEGDAHFEDPKSNKDPVAAIVKFNQAVTGASSVSGTYSEVRDCRTFYDPKKDETWIVGSRLEIKLEKDGTASEAFSELFVESGANGAMKQLHKTVIKLDPKKLNWRPTDYEVPVSHELADGSFLVAARVGGSALVAAQLEHDKKVRGSFKSYPGYYNMPDASEDGPDDVLIASLKEKDGYVLRAMRIPGTKSELPAAFSKVTTDEDDSHSESRPEFLRDSKGQRWVAYIENAEKGKGHLEIIPVNAGFRATGKPYGVTKEDEKATEARLVAQKDGGFVVAYVRDAGNGTGELVTEDLDCKVMQK